MKPIENESIYGAWLQAAQHLLGCAEARDYNVILEVSRPGAFDEHDRCLRDVVDRFLKGHQKWPLDTVANTIFPLGLYRSFGLEGVFTKYPETVFPKIRLKNNGTDWGRYAYRLVRVEAGDRSVVIDSGTGEPVNPLKKIVDKLRNYDNNPKRAIYEAGLIDPLLEIPIYRPLQDRCYTMGGPCLSHLSFKVMPDKRLALTAFYRSHFYVERALGNLLGLSWLLCSVAHETGFSVGSLTCISSMAQLEPGSWSKHALKAMLAECADIYEGAPAWGGSPKWIREASTG
ncbi:hypothetical protein [Magnetospirillum sulfuroxidans]|uniref:Thymidylate synthase n=1 Tax=Magnetospirillum sulfuroxidans TaxID=611300 RepID=A0ABS5IH80_9PROT|nr:hypothetical protein [Magnetospirillum sulfuroxidans]MBR9973781.1 hypothetical protein [Magnetospirillum sulfuroxidans]